MTITSALITLANTIIASVIASVGFAATLAFCLYLAGKKLIKEAKEYLPTWFKQIRHEYLLAGEQSRIEETRAKSGNEFNTKSFLSDAEIEEGLKQAREARIKKQNKILKSS
jgi:hypothetical protein